MLNATHVKKTDVNSITSYYLQRQTLLRNENIDKQSTKIYETNKLISCKSYLLWILIGITVFPLQKIERGGKRMKRNKNCKFKGLDAKN